MLFRHCCNWHWLGMSSSTYNLISFFPLEKFLITFNWKYKKSSFKSLTPLAFSTEFHICMFKMHSLFQCLPLARGVGKKGTGWRGGRKRGRNRERERGERWRERRRKGGKEREIFFSSSPHKMSLLCTEFLKPTEGCHFKSIFLPHSPHSIHKDI